MRCRRGVGLLVLVLIALSMNLLALPSASCQLRYEWSRSRSMKVVAVTSSEKGYVGVVANLTVTVAYPGSGHVYFSADPLTMIDTQGSARTALLVACSVLNLNPLSYDVFVRIESPSLILGGPSAGAAMTIALAAALADLPVNGSVAITGMINPDGTIGPVGGIPEKLEAAARAGVKVFLIPLGQRYSYRERVIVERGPFWVRRYVERELVDLYAEGEKLGVRVVEVAKIEDALPWFTGLKVSEAEEANVSYSAYTYEVIRGWAEEFEEDYTALRGEVDSALRSLPPSARTGLEDLVRHADELVQQAGTLIDEGRVYEASSRLLQACITLSYVEECSRLLREGEGVVESLGVEVNRSLEEASRLVFTATPTGMRGFEALMASRLRLYMASRLLEEAQQAYDSGDYAKALFDLVSARWRIVTAVKWIELNEEPDGLQPPGADETLRIAGSLIYEARTVVSYAESLVSGSNQQLSDAVKYLEIAEEAYRSRDGIGAIGASVYTIAKATTCLHEAFAVSKDEVLRVLRDEAVKALSQASSRGLEPVLALGYFEAGELRGDEQARLFFYELSAFHARLTLIALSVSGGEWTTSTLTPWSPPSTQPTPQGGGSAHGPQLALNMVMILLVALAVGAAALALAELARKGPA